jgi:hypothetical protein
MSDTHYVSSSRGKKPQEDKPLNSFGERERQSVGQKKRNTSFDMS